MENNGRDLTNERFRHINIKRFFMKDRVDKVELAVEYCPTKLKITDCMTKLLQGKQFEIFRILMMGWKSANDILLRNRKLAKERVGNMIVADKSNPLESRNVNDKSDSADKRKTFKEAM